MKKLTFLLVFISIFGYAQTPITDANIQTAVDLWVSDSAAATTTYGNISNWDVSQITNMSELFFGKTTFNDDISNWDVSSSINMDYMFFGAEAFNQDIGTWNVSSVTNMRGMFDNATSFNKDISNWNVSSVTNMSYMFDAAHTFNQDVSSWDVSSVTTMDSMFISAYAFDQAIGNWNVSNVTNMSRMFYKGQTFNQDLSFWDVSNVTDMSFMFIGSVLSTDNYDNILNGWSQQNVQHNVSLGAQGIKYCNGEAARQNLIDNRGWIIEDGGLDCSTAGVEDQTQLDISIYPNPTDNTLFISGNETPIAVAIYNVLGKEVLSIKNTNNINLKALPSGVYVIRISDGVGQTNRKFIKN